MACATRSIRASPKGCKRMQLALLAPVPCIHLRSALDQGVRNHQRTAFGTNASNSFIDKDGRPIVERGWQVLIYASRPETDEIPYLFRAEHVVVTAVFCGWDWARGKSREYVGDAVRPPTTLNEATKDTGWEGYWEVAELRQIKPLVHFKNLLSLPSGKKFKKGFVPERPMLVNWIDG